MRLICDLEIHSRFSRAVSQKSNLEYNELWGMKKGNEIIGTGDFTHPEWRKECREKLEDPDGSGLYRLKKEYSMVPDSRIRFLFSGEVSCIYRKNDATRRVHLLIFAPNGEAADAIAKDLEHKGGKLRSDGRPILGMDAKVVLEIVLTHGGSMIPAHVWTPWFGLFGSKSGFDSIEECFEDLSPFIYAVETGLSSDPRMNWRVPFLDDRQIVSFSDAHSPQNIGREATVIAIAEETYTNIFKAFQDPDGKNKIDFTIEFFPEEGKYHYDGHSACAFSCAPPQTKKLKGICPKCHRPLTVGVMNRVEMLAAPDRTEDFSEPHRPGYRKIIPLPEVIAAAFGVQKTAKRVMEYYEEIIAVAPEFDILLFQTPDELSFLRPEVREAIVKMRAEQITIIPGYDGVFGKIEVPKGRGGQGALF